MRTTPDEHEPPGEGASATRGPRGRARQLRVAAVQMRSRLGRIEANLDHATGLAEQAAAEGARLVLFHELMPGGYAWDESAWSGAEAANGPTAAWAAALGRRLGVWVGTSFLEAAGDDFWNTFLLTGPDGTEAGRVRKAFPSIFEARTFRGEPGPHVIETPIGRIGVAICFDGHTAAVTRQLAEADVDLVLAPHCYCVPRSPSRATSQGDIDRLVRNIAELAPLQARTLGVPVVVTNRVGEWDVPKGAAFVFPGQATIADSDGSVLSRLGTDEGIAVGDVRLDPARKTHQRPRAYSRWIYPGPPGREVLRLVEWWAGLRYRRSGRRRHLARMVADPAAAFTSRG